MKLNTTTVKTFNALLNKLPAAEAKGYILSGILMDIFPLRTQEMVLFSNCCVISRLIISFSVTILEGVVELLVVEGGVGVVVGISCFHFLHCSMSLSDAVCELLLAEKI